MVSNAVVWASQVTQVVAISIFLFEGFAYNCVFLARVLPALGKQAFVAFFATIFNLFWGLALWSYFAAHVSDPGRVPASWRDFVDEVGEALPIAPARPEWQPGKATFCKKCDAPRPERAHHCVVCSSCVLRMDHHCPWINNCVGFCNQKYFLLLGVYACMASAVGLATSLPQLGYCVTALARLEGEVTSEDPVRFARSDGYISEEEETLLEERTTVRAAKERCAALRGCAGFTFEDRTEGPDAEEGRLVYYKAAWNLLGEGQGWTSYRQERGRLDGTDVAIFLAFGALAAMVGALLAPMLATHLPLATQNLTTIEDNYENMPNPFDQGGTPANLAQIFGAYGPDWLVPIPPWQPLSDGVSFARSDERVMPDGLPERPVPGEEDELNQKLWRLRYRIRTPAAALAEMADTGPLTTLTRWWSGP